MWLQHVENGENSARQVGDGLRFCSFIFGFYSKINTKLFKRFKHTSDPRFALTISVAAV